MKTFAKIIFLQLCWLLVAIYGKSVNPLLQIIAALLIVGIDYNNSRSVVTYGRYLFLIAFFTFCGFLNDSSLIWLKFVSKESYHYGNLSLWIIFIAYYEHIFLKFKNWPLLFVSLIGGVGGVTTYWSAVNLGAIVINPGMEVGFTLSQFVFWAAFFPISLRLFYKDDYWNTFLDKSILYSFDQTGYRRHKKKFTEDLSSKNITGKNVLVTGATGGIGSEVATFLSRINGSVYFTGRNLEKGKKFEQQNKNSTFVSLDMANWREVYEFAKKSQTLDYIVFNAGSMPEELMINENGIEFQCASQLLGHYYLLLWLREFKKLSPNARIVLVSSGGMYLKKLDLKSLFENSNYDKVDTYANVKRAQITLVEELAKMSEWKDFFIYSMHPGWVKTEGLKNALPKFYSFMEKRLRTIEEGADTILWCLLSDKAPETGGFYFDRKKVSPYISQKFNPTSLERAELLNFSELILKKYISQISSGD